MDSGTYDCHTHMRCLVPNYTMLQLQSRGNNGIPQPFTRALETIHSQQLQSPVLQHASNLLLSPPPTCDVHVAVPAVPYPPPCCTLP
jgi:hypothetical protein